MKRFMLSRVACLSICSLLLAGCTPSDGARDIRDYYFPLKKLQDGMVYQFQSVTQPEAPPAYWYFRSILQDDKKALVTTYYEQDLLPLQLAREEMVSNGMLLEEMFLYGRDSLPGGEQPRSRAELIAGNVFPFTVRDSGGIFLYHVRWQDPDDALVTHTVIKNRYFLGDTTIVLEGKTYPAIQFALREGYEMDSFGVFETTYTGLEIYAKGIGLAYYRKEISPEFTLEYRLVRRFPMEELERRFSRPPGNSR